MRAEPAQVVGVPSQVRQDERRLRMLREQPVALAHQLFERRKPRAVLVAAIRIQRQLQPSLVVVVERLEELRRVGDVNEDRDVQPRGGLPDDVQLRIVELEPACRRSCARACRSPS